jgi:hypothetical protein
LGWYLRETLGDTGVSHFSHPIFCTQKTFFNEGYLSSHNAKDPTLIPGLGSGRKSR